MFIIQMTGLSGSGKSSLAFLLKDLLGEKGLAVQVVDGDQYRKTICRDLGFSADDRRENIRRLGRIANQYRQNGIISILAAINPFEDVRKELADQYGAKTVWIRCDLDVLIRRDTKGLYRRALLPDDDPMKISNLTGVNDVYEIPASANLVIDTSYNSIEFSKKELVDYMLRQLAFCAG